MPGPAPGALITLPKPVVTEQPISAATSIGTSSGSGAQACAGETMRSAKTPSFDIWKTSLPSASLSRAVPSYWRTPVCWFVSHSCGLPERHIRQCPQFETNDSTQRSPGFTLVTPGPTCSTVPAPSCPSTAGSGSTALPSITC